MEDEELENIKKKQLEDLLKQQNINNILNETPVMELTSQNFNQEISNNDLLLVDFWAEWCGPCKSMHPIFTRMAKKYKQVRFARVNVDNAQDIAMKYGVQSIPTFIMFKNGIFFYPKMLIDAQWCLARKKVCIFTIAHLAI